MESLRKRMAAANNLLAPYAVPIEGTLGRTYAEEPDATRFPFQRDRDRIIHSKAFRRLKGKTQVFVSGVGDHYRTRLTHTMEVAQISRDMARTLSLNEDLAECIALAHDLGHPPFGHAGEEALDEWMRGHGSSFEHNQQSLRIVTVLDDRCPRYTGLNLNSEVLEGLIKHRTPHDEGAEGDKGAEGYRHPSLEAQVVNIADEIAYTGHDVDDGLRAGLFTIDALREIEIVSAVEKQQYGSLRGGLIHHMVMDVYGETERRLAEQDIATLDDVYECAEAVVTFSESLRRKLDKLRGFLWKQMYLHPDVIKKTEEGKRIVVSLCDAFMQDPPEQVLAIEQSHACKRFEAVKDYVAGMTDDYARATGADARPLQGDTLTD